MVSSAITPASLASDLFGELSKSSLYFFVCAGAITRTPTPAAISRPINPCQYDPVGSNPTTTRERSPPVRASIHASNAATPAAVLANDRAVSTHPGAAQNRATCVCEPMSSPTTSIPSGIGPLKALPCDRTGNLTCDRRCAFLLMVTSPLGMG